MILPEFMLESTLESLSNQLSSEVFAAVFGDVGLELIEEDEVVYLSVDILSDWNDGSYRNQLEKACKGKSMTVLCL